MPAPTSVLCAIPGLIWPGTGLSELLNSLPLPGLSALLTQANVRHEPPCSFDVWLTCQFGLSGNPPFAALRLAGEQGTPPGSDTLWVCADPVSLRFARQHLLLDAPETLSLQAEEMAALLDALNKTFADIGKFQCTSPEYCYLALNTEHAARLPVTLAPLADVVGRPIAQFQAQGEQAAWWSKLANDLQVFCHNHPVNAAREARHAPALNGLWLWGLGRSPQQLTAPSANMAARQQNASRILAGLTRLSQTNIEAFDPQHPAEWSVLDALHEPAQHRDMTAWCRAFEALDSEVFVPLAQQLRAGRISRLRIVAPGDSSLTHFDISPAPRWKFWQHRASKAQLLASLTGPAI